MDEVPEPGAAKLGNFPDYYKFNPSSKRLKYVSKLSLDDLRFIKWNNSSSSGRDAETLLQILDIGCNTGELTVDLYRWLRDLLKPLSQFVQCLAIDIDESLITCASKKYEDLSPHANSLSQQYQSDLPEGRVRFEAADVMASQPYGDDVTYSMTFCFSVTLWIHINHGDAGLNRFLTHITSRTAYLLIETQPWKCYRSAVRRAKRANQPPFPYYDSLAVRCNVTEYIDNYIISKCHMTKVKELGTTDWGRNIVLYCNNNAMK